MKRAAILCAVLFILAPLPVWGGEDISGELIQSYSELYGQQLEQGAGELLSSGVPYAEGFNLSELISRIAAGEIPIEPKALAKELLYALFGGVVSAARTMAAVVAVVMLSSLLSGITDGFSQSGAGKAAYYVCFMTVTALAASAFYDCVSTAASTIENLGLFMACIVPVMVTALLASGAVISAAAIEPTLIGIIQISVALIKNIFVPLVMVGTGLGIINSMSESLKTTRLITLVNSWVKYGLSVSLTIFAAFAGLRSIAASGADALTLKLTKFASSNLIPVVGGILSDSVETVIRCSAVIKNAVGIGGVVLVFFIAVTPIINIISVMVVFRITAAFCEPVASKSMAECISCMANGISMAFSMLVAVKVMFIIIITIMINISV